jgi:hypothetical protein
MGALDREKRERERKTRNEAAEDTKGEDAKEEDVIYGMNKTFMRKRGLGDGVGV